MTKEEILKNNNIIIETIKRKGKVIIINNKYVIKDIKRIIDYYEYLETRGFNNYPKVYTKVNDEIELTDYIEDKNIPKEQKVEDLTYLISILHLKTLFDKQIELDNIKKIYEDTINKYNEYNNYYHNLQDKIEECIYMSPADYYLIRNISLIYKSISKSKEYLDKWFKEIENSKTIRYAYTHGNLKEEHLLENNNLYLISWDKSKIDNFIYDLNNLYRNNYLNISLKDMLSIYEKKLPLKKEEKDYLFSILLIPDKIDYNEEEYIKLKKTVNMIMYLEKTYSILESNSKEPNNNTN